MGMDEYRHVDMAGNDGYNHASVNGVPKAERSSSSSVTNIITCWSYNKHYESGQRHVLIDDRIALKESWEAKGGIFVHHTSTDSTLQQLQEIGVLTPSNAAAARADAVVVDGPLPKRNAPSRPAQRKRRSEIHITFGQRLKPNCAHSSLLSNGKLTAASGSLLLVKRHLVACMNITTS